MISNRMSAFALSAAIATLCFAAPATAAKFDGNWNMVLTTTNGHCGVIKMGMAVNGGHISATSGKFVMHKIALAGLISRSGATKINGVAGPRQAVGTGRFTQPRGAESGTAQGLRASARAFGPPSALSSPLAEPKVPRLAGVLVVMDMTRLLSSLAPAV